MEVSIIPAVSEHLNLFVPMTKKLKEKEDFDMRLLDRLKLLVVGLLLCISVAFMGARVSYAGIEGDIFDSLACIADCNLDFADCVFGSGNFDCTLVDSEGLFVDLDLDCVFDCASSANDCVNSCTNAQ